jgi:glycosyl hydrolase family 99
VAKHLTLAGMILVAAVAARGVEPARVEPAFLRLQIVLTTDARQATLAIDPGTVVTASTPTDGEVRVTASANQVSFTRDAAGPAETRVTLILSGADVDAPVRWRLTLAPSATARLEIYNANVRARPRLVDRFDANASASVFETRGRLLVDGGPLAADSGPEALVMAFYYPWFQHPTWESDRLQDRPLYLYSAEQPTEVAHSVRDARDAGLDAIIVSWRGDTDWNDRRLRFILDQAQSVGLRVSILVETLSATDGPEGTVKPLSADKMRAWLEKAFDVFAPHPAFLKVGGQPVVFVYVADSFPVSDWSAIARSLKGSRRNVLLMADTSDPALLASFDGAFTYATAGVPLADLRSFDQQQARQTQTYNLLAGGARRVSTATVMPGYDDTLLVDRDTTMRVDRANGGRYDREWEAALSAEPDWVLVTSWNEFWENTQIEPSQRYGRAYQSRTARWREIFRSRRSGRTSPPIAIQLSR